MPHLAQVLGHQHHAGDRGVPRHDHRVLDAVRHGGGLRADVQQRGQELGGGRWIAGQELGPAERAVLGADLRADALPRLPERHHGAGRVLDGRHAAGVEHVERFGQHRAAVLDGAHRAGIGIVHRQIDVPVRRNAHLRLLGRLREDPRRAGAVDGRRRVEPLARLVDRHIPVAPAEQAGVEPLGGVLIGGGQVDPRRRPLQVAIDSHVYVPSPVAGVTSNPSSAALLRMRSSHDRNSNSDTRLRTNSAVVR